MTDTSREEIERWSDILQRNHRGEGKQRLARYVCTMTMGSDLGETADARMQDRGLTEFVEWARRQRDK